MSFKLQVLSFKFFMLPQALQNLQKYFEEFPGVGPRQANRYAFFILKQPKEKVVEFIQSLKTLNEKVTLCANCYLPSDLPADLPAEASAQGGRNTTNKTSKYDSVQCKICTDKNRNKNIVYIVEKEQDAMNLEKIRVHNGIYLVLGENISPTNEKVVAKDRIKNLIKNLSNGGEIKNKEIVLALNNTREGNFTSMYIQQMFRENNLEKVKLISLGRGLSTGSELEYADEETLRNALKNRG